jgi:hypothetical protein
METEKNQKRPKKDYTTSRNAARTLYMTGAFTLLELAAMFGVSETSMGKWKQEGEWERKRIEFNLNSQTSAANIRNIVLHTSTVLAKRAEDLAAEGKVIDKGELDGLYKMFISVRHDEISLDQFVKICTQILKYIEIQNLSLAKQVAPIVNELIAQKSKSDGI